MIFVSARIFTQLRLMEIVHTTQRRALRSAKDPAQSQLSGCDAQSHRLSEQQVTSYLSNP